MTTYPDKILNRGFVALIMLSIFLVGGCRQKMVNIPLTNQEKTWLAEHDGKIVLGHDPDAYPVEFTDEKGVFRGIAADYVKLLEKRLHFTFKIAHPKTWNEAVEQAKERKIDVLCAFTKNADREKWMLFTKSYLIVPTIILTRNNDHRKLTLDKMKGMKVTFTKGWVIDDYLRKYQGYLKLFPAVDSTTAMNYLSTGQADAWVTPLTIASNVIEKNKVTNLRIAGKVDFAFKLAFASRKDWPILNRILDKGLRMISPEERKTIFDKWVHIQQESIFVSEKFWAGLAAFAILLLFLLIIISIWNKSLKRQVDRHTTALKHELLEREKAEENLQEMIDRLDLATSTVKMGIWDWDIQKNKLIWDDRMYELYGMKEEDFGGAYEAWLAGVHPEDKAFSDRETRLAIEGKKEYDTEFRVVWPDGTIRVLKANGKVIWDANGTPTRMSGVNLDISGQRQTEEELRKINTIFHSLLENSPIYIFFKDQDIRSIYLSRNYENMLGMPLDAIVGKTMDELFPSDLAKSMIEDDKKILHEGKRIEVDEQLNGRQYTTIKFPIADRGKQTILAGFTLDVTERKKAEQERAKLQEQLHQTQRMQSIGTLAGGIAHDFNNMLTVLTGNISYAQSQLRSDDEMYSVLSEAMNGAKQAQNLTQQLLTFAKGGEPIKKLCRINKLLMESARFVTSGAQSKCDFELAEDLWSAEVDAGQINQTISNLVINADQAMPNGGIITIKSENVKLDEYNSFQIPAGKYVKIIVEDQGIGIQEKYISSIFEPYFTTKQKGSGLGLATTYSIIKRHGGHITVSSGVGQGTSFQIYLPALTKQIQEIEDKQQSLHTGQGKVLVMDDQAAVLNVIQRVLTHMGYEVESAQDGVQAIELYRQAYETDRPHDLVILDLTIPGGMGGARTIAELLKINPKVKAVVSSGYSNDPIMANYQDYGFCGVVPKPYTKKDLVQLFNEIL